MLSVTLSFYLKNKLLLFNNFLNKKLNLKDEKKPNDIHRKFYFSIVK